MLFRSCAVMGGDILLERAKQRLGIDEGQTTPCGRVSLERLECNAACDYAPVVMVNWEFFDNQTPASAVELVSRLERGEDVTCSHLDNFLNFILCCNSEWSYVKKRYKRNSQIL